MKRMDLNGAWEFSFRRSVKMEELDPVEERPDEWINVPGCFDTLPHHYCQRGCAVYSRTFELEKGWRNGWLRIDGMGLRGQFRLDGRPLGGCALPYTQFELETGALSAGRHRITAILDKAIDTVFSSPEITGLCLWQMNDAKSYHRSGDGIRKKPLSQNLAGVYDQYRRAKKSASVVAEKFRVFPGRESPGDPA